MRTKKIVSLFAAFAMIATMISSFTVASAEGAPVMTNTFTKLSNEDFNAIMGDNIPAGYDAYSLVTGLTDLGTLSATKVGLNVNGTRLFNAGIAVTFDNMENVNKDWCGTLGGTLEGAGGFGTGSNANVYSLNFNGTAKTAYPAATATIEGAIDEAFYTVFVVKSGVEVNATIRGTVGIATYASGNIAAGSELKYGHGQANSLSYDITSYKFGGAPTVEPAQVAITAHAGKVEDTFYFATVVTPGDEAITAADVTVNVGAKARKAELDSSMFSLLDGSFTFYVGNRSTTAGTYTATATVVADTTATAVADYVVE